MTSIFQVTKAPARGCAAPAGGIGRAAFAKADIRDEQGRLVATAASTCLLFLL